MSFKTKVIYDNEMAPKLQHAPRYINTIKTSAYLTVTFLTRDKIYSNDNR